MLLQAFEHQNPPTRIVYGEGSVSTLPELMRSLGASRAFAVCGKTVSGGPQMARVRASLGDRLVGEFHGVRPQGGIANLQAGAEEVVAHAADVLISVGGGATMDSAKCIALLLAREAPIEDYRVRGSQGVGVPRSLPSGTLRHIAIPTTAGSSSEIMPWAGIRDEETRQKMLFRDRRLIPRIAVLDPEMVVPTEAWLTATSGVTALARAVESLYSRSRQPIADAYALRALRMLATALPRAVARGDDLQARGNTQIAALMSGIAADNAMVSLVHAVGHSLGGRYALQHGVAHAILLPQAAALNLPFIGPTQRLVAEALGIETGDRSDTQAGELAAAAIGRLIQALPLPHRLRDVGVADGDLPGITQATMDDPMFSHCPRTLSFQQVQTMLERSW